MKQALFRFVIWLLLGMSPALAAEPLPLEADQDALRTLEYSVSEGTWMSLSVAPDGKSLLFDLLGDIYRLPITGGMASPVLTGMAFDSQPLHSPDGQRFAFISDRSGNENVWIARADGSGLKQLSFVDDNTEFTSPAWSADGRYVYASTIRPDMGVFELWAFDTKGNKPRQITHAKATPATPKDYRHNALGAWASPDGRSLYYAVKTGGFKTHMELPVWHIARRDLPTGREDKIITAQGSAMRPALSADGQWLAYATRLDGRTGLRLRNLITGEDRWLVYPVQTDQQEAWHTMDTMPRYDFTPDGTALLFTADNRIKRVDVTTGEVTDIPFTARVKLAVGPSLRRHIAEETGPVKARLIQTPVYSPDGSRVAFSALGAIYVMDAGGDAPRRLTADDVRAYQPSWTADGKALLYVTWTAGDKGHIWRVKLNGGAPERLTADAGFYSYPVMAADGSILALRGNHHERMIQAMDLLLVPTRQTDIVRLPATGGAAQVIASGLYSGPPQLTNDAERFYIVGAEGLVSFRLDGADRRVHLNVTGAGYYFLEGRVPVDDIRISPDGQWVLAQSISQLYLIPMPKAAQDGSVPTVDLNRSPLPHKRLTQVGADFIGWADGGRSISWSAGSTLYRRPLGGVKLDGSPDLAEAAPDVQKSEAVVELPRDIPRGALVLRGGTVITMKGDEVIKDADVVIVDNRIAAVGKRGQVAVPKGAEIRDIKGRYVLPGFIDTHAHWAEIRRGILDFENYGFLANLAYGVTAGLDVSTLSIDMIAYQDLLDAGLMTGLRAYSTGPGVFSYNEFASLDQAVAVLRRYKDHYRLHNLKQYRAGNRQQRQWVAQAAKIVGLMPTTEGADNFKLDLTQILDGFAGNEHSLPVEPLGQDVIELMVRTRVSYTPTLVLGSGPPAMTRYITHHDLATDPKVRRFIPKYFIDIKTQRGHWYRDSEYIYPRYGAAAAKVLRAGGLVGVGSHSELEGVSYHAELQALAEGGLTPREILHAATLGGAEVIGRQHILGSLEPGKLADLIVLNKNPLEDIQHALALALVMKNGRLYNAETLDEIWPRQKPLPPLWFWDQGPEFDNH